MDLPWLELGEGIPLPDVRGDRGLEQGVDVQTDHLHLDVPGQARLPDPSLDRRRRRLVWPGEQLQDLDLSQLTVLRPCLDSSDDEDAPTPSYEEWLGEQAFGIYREWRVGKGRPVWHAAAVTIQRRVREWRRRREEHEKWIEDAVDEYGCAGDGGHVWCASKPPAIPSVVVPNAVPVADSIAASTGSKGVRVLSGVRVAGRYRSD